MNAKKIYTAFAISLAAIFITLTAFGAAIISKLNTTKNDLENQLLRTNGEIDWLRNDINSLKQSLENSIRTELEKQASILTSYKLVAGEPDFESMTAEITLSVTPKEYSESTTAVFYVGGQQTEMERNGNSFEGSVTLAATNNYSNPSVTFCDNGVYKSETIKTTIKFEQYFIYNAKSDFKGRVSYSNNKISFNGTVRSYFYAQTINTAVSSANLCVYKNGVELQKTALTVSQAVNYETGFVFDKSFDVKLNDEIMIYIEIKDNFGLTYRVFVAGAGLNERGFYETNFVDGYEVFDSAGNRLEFKNL